MSSRNRCFADAEQGHYSSYIQEKVFVWINAMQSVVFTGPPLEVMCIHYWTTRGTRDISVYAGRNCKQLPLTGSARHSQVNGSQLILQCCQEPLTGVLSPCRLGDENVTSHLMWCDMWQNSLPHRSIDSMMLIHQCHVWHLRSATICPYPW